MTAPAMEADDEQRCLGDCCTCQHCMNEYPMCTCPRCPDCDGTGDMATTGDCPTCDGMGVLPL